MKRTTPKPSKTKQTSSPSSRTVKKQSKKKVEKKPNGRPPIYNPKETPILAHKFCLLGATNQKLADLFEVSISTIELWMREYPMFLRAVKEGRAIADAEVVHSTYNRAKGYTVQDKSYKRLIKRDENDEPIRDEQGNLQYEMVCTNMTERHVPADPALNKFWLWNRTKFSPKEEQWSDRQEMDMKSSDGTMTPRNTVVFLPAKTEVE